MSFSIDKWIWKMNWCKKNGISPAPACNWEKAEKAYVKHNKEEKNENSTTMDTEQTVSV